jgi:hypothetical protein
MDPVILKHEAMRLPVRERALLADALLGSLDDEAAERIEALWGAESEARLAAYKRGESEALDGPQVLAELRSRLKR